MIDAEPWLAPRHRQARDSLSRRSVRRDLSSLNARRVTAVTRPHRFQQRALHHLSRLASMQPREWEGSDPKSRRRRQQRQLIQQYVAADPEGFRWLVRRDRGQRFWKALRWGGPGLLIGWWLSRS